ncbi:Sel1 repeat family protein [Rhizophagus irregularis DAOM 181602=DAOM 197198]|nr:Sel1 repeat family protein [Rhizophagus irregularis DAOM 181602=DAOM 197198]
MAVDKEHSDSYEYGTIAEKNELKHLNFIKNRPNKAADKEHSFAQNNLGILYLKGECFKYRIGIEKNYHRAFYFYNKSIENGYVKANFQLGYFNKNDDFFYKSDDDRPINNDLDIVHYWYCKASENDNKVTLYKLGEIYELGRGIQKNDYRVFHFYEKSANQKLIVA